MARAKARSVFESKGQQNGDSPSTGSAKGGEGSGSKDEEQAGGMSQASQDVTKEGPSVESVEGRSVTESKGYGSKVDHSADPSECGEGSGSEAGDIPKEAPSAESAEGGEGSGSKAELIPKVLTEELPDDMPAVLAYFLHVEPYLYSHKSATRLLGLDGDQEIFAALMMKAVPDLKSDAVSEDETSEELKMCDITIEDILGPKIKGKRDVNFSLLTYSFNLNPAMRHQLSFEMGQMLSDSELVLPAGDKRAPDMLVLSENQIHRKASILNDSQRRKAS